VICQYVNQAVARWPLAAGQSPSKADSGNNRLQGK